VNLLTLGERVIGESLAKSIVDAYLGAEIQGGRHERRRNQIRELESLPRAMHRETKLIEGRTK
jgi:ribose 5-phosphate isomerase B